MSETNPQVTPAQTDNTGGINIDNILGGGTPVTSPVMDNLPPAPEEPAGLPPVTPPVLPTNEPVTPAVTPEQPTGTEPAPASTEPQADDFAQLLFSAEGLSAEDSTLRTSILNTFGATGADDKGNLLDANNRIILSRENLDKYVETGEVLLDAKGNQVNELGEVLVPAEQVVAPNTFVTSAQSALEKEFGFQLLNAEGKPKTYSNTPEGNAEFARDVASNAQVNAITSFLNGNPELKQLYYHFSTGGTLDNYVNETFDYSKVDVAELTREQRLNYIKSSYEKQGLSNMASTVKLLEGASDEMLVEATSDALIALNKITEDTRTQAEQDYIAQQQAQQESTTKYWNDIESRINEGKVGEITIPDSEKKNFYEYLAVVKDKDGRSQEQIDLETEDPNFGLMVSYLRYKKLNLDDLINIRSRTNKVHSARERFKIAQPAVVHTAPNPSARPSGTISLDSLTN